VASDLTQLWPLLRGFCGIDQHPFDEVRIAGALEPLLVDDTYGQVWVLDSPHGLLGYCVVTWGYSLESGGREALLDEIYVSTRSRGDGSQLLAQARAGARDAGAKVMFLETETHNERARAFYARHGFATDDSVWMSCPIEG
jgi:GNAT superfamily N-acetyltransferase